MQRSRAAAGRSYPTPKVRGSGQEELPHIQGAVAAWVGVGGPRGATLRSRSGGAGCEEIPLVKGKEQQLHFAGAAVKRYPTSKVRETQVRW